MTLVVKARPFLEPVLSNERLRHPCIVGIMVPCHDVRMVEQRLLVVLEGVPFLAFLGCLEEERERTQGIRLDLTLTIDAPLADELAQTVDYRLVLKEAGKWIARRHWNLLETLSMELARRLLECFPPLCAVKARVHKPQAPLGVPFTDLYAEVTLTRENAFIFPWKSEATVALIGLGSNLGDRRETMRCAMRGLVRLGMLRACSSLYETEPVGLKEQPSFLNAVASLETRIPPRELLADLKELEVELGRGPSLRWGPREIDLDLLFYGDLVLQEDDLVLPHPRLHERGFVLVPALEVAGDFVHPVFRRPIADLWRQWSEEEEVSWFQGPDWSGEFDSTPSFRLPSGACLEEIRTKLSRHGVPQDAQLRVF